MIAMTIMTSIKVKPVSGDFVFSGIAARMAKV